jgi:hypothetical protein
MILLKLALRAAERGDAEAAAEALRGVIAMQEEQPAAMELRAVSRSKFAEMIGATPEHIGHLIKRREIPPEAVLGHGRGQRVIVAAALAALQSRPKAPSTTATADPIEAEGAAYVRRRGGLRVLRGAGR